jgi:hypothetical protein
MVTGKPTVKIQGPKTHLWERADGISKPASYSAVDGKASRRSPPGLEDRIEPDLATVWQPGRSGPWRAEARALGQV